MARRSITQSCGMPVALVEREKDGNVGNVGNNSGLIQEIDRFFYVTLHVASVVVYPAHGVLSFNMSTQASQDALSTTFHL